MPSLPFRLLTLGTASLESPNGEAMPTSAQRPRHLAMLAYLAAAGQRGRTRGDLVALLWPRNKDGVHDLAELEHQLSKSLDVYLIETTGNDGRRLLASAITTDLQDFRDAIRNGRLSEAVALYAGPFLDGLSLLHQPPGFGDWMETEREKLCAQLRTALIELADTGQWAAAGAYWDRVDRLADDDQDAAAAYVRALVRAGQQDRAEYEQKRLVGLLPRRRRAAGGALVAAGAELAAGAVPALTEVGSTGLRLLVSPAQESARNVGGAPLQPQIEARSAVRGGARPADVTVLELNARGRQRFRHFTPEALAEAEIHFQEALKADPEYAPAHAGLGSTLVFRYIARPEPPLLEAGIRHLNRALALDPTMGEPYLWLAYAYSRSGDFARATRAALQAVPYDEDDPESYYFTGAAYHTLALSKPDPSYMSRAVRRYQDAVGLDSSYGWAWNGLAHLYMLHGQYGAAANAIDRAIATEEGARPSFTRAPVASGALAMNGILLLREGKLDSAEEALLLARDRYYQQAHLWAPHFGVLADCALGRVHELRGEFSRAIQQYRTTRAAVNEHRGRMGMGHHAVRVHIGLACAHFRDGRPNEAADEAAIGTGYMARRKDFDFSWAWGGSFAETHFELARYHAIAGEHAAALENLEEAARWGWSDPEAVKVEPTFKFGIQHSDRLKAVLVDMSRPRLPT